MGGRNKAIIKAALEALYFTGAHHVMRPFFGGVGAIFTMHHVRPARADPFQPNRLLEITPDFLEEVCAELRRACIEVIPLDEVHRRLISGDFKRRFVAITFDDGYRDNMTYAYPIMKRHGMPFAIFIPTSFPEQVGDLWWLALEAVIAQNVRISLVIDGEECRFECRTTAEKYKAYEAIYWWLRCRPTEDQVRQAVRDLTGRYGIDATQFCTELCMGWDELAELASDPLVTIGGHTVNHVMLKKVSEGEAREEINMGAAAIEVALGVRPQHLSYPVGDITSAGPREFRIAAEAGFKTAVTTRPGVLFPQHRSHLMALPRISLNGDFQRVRYTRVMLSGTPTALMNGFRRVDAA